jgi:carbonic anhydrase
MERLLQGYRTFRAEHWPNARALYEKLARGQSPRLLVIACSDSRVDPATIFGAEPGELFVVRNVANLVPPFETSEGLHGTSAAIEFAVQHLAVRTILVLGHASCGGVSAALDGKILDKSVFLKPWIELLAPARARCAHCVEAEAQEMLERESIKLSLERLMSFPFVADAVAAGALRLEGARFGIEHGRLEVLNHETGAFEDIP